MARDILGGSSDDLGSNNIGAIIIFEGIAPVEGIAEFDSGELDLSRYRAIEIEFSGRSDNNDIYEQCRIVFNSDNTALHYHQATMWSNPLSSGGGGFGSQWGTAVGILAGYATGDTAQAGYVSEWRARIDRPGDARLPMPVDATTRYIENRDSSHLGTKNGPEHISIAGFWTPDTADAIEQILVYPELGNEFVEGSRLIVRGIM